MIYYVIRLWIDDMNRLQFQYYLTMIKIDIFRHISTIPFYCRTPRRRRYYLDLLLYCYCIKVWNQSCFRTRSVWTQFIFICNKFYYSFLHLFIHSHIRITYVSKCIYIYIIYLDIYIYRHICVIHLHTMQRNCEFPCK